MIVCKDNDVVDVIVIDDVDILGYCIGGVVILYVFVYMLGCR